MDAKQLKGCGTALVTPFTGDGKLDEKALRRLVQFQIREEIDFLVPCGTTGESPTLSRDEHRRVVEVVCEGAQGKVPVVAGAGGNNTQAVIEQIRELEKLKIDAILSVAPYYNKPTQEGFYQHFRAIAESTSLPVIVYNVPGRTGSNVEPSTLGRLADIPNILGVKEASGNISQQADLFRAVPESFKVFSGDDSITLPLMALGGVGVISVASNEVPAEMTRLTHFCLEGKFAEARKLQHRLLPLMQANFLESNPIPVKAALAMMGLIEEVYRLPLVPMKPANRARLEQILVETGVVRKAHGIA